MPGRGADTARWLLLTGTTRGLAAFTRRRGELVGTAVYDPAFLVDPYPFYEQIRAAGRLVPGSLLWLTADYRICRELLRSDAMGKPHPQGPDSPLLLRWFDRLMTPRMAHPLLPPSMLSVDPPAHTRYRRLVSKAFTPRAVEALRPRIEQLADELLTTRRVNGRLDLVSDYAGLLPVAVICEVLGVPAPDQARFRALGARVARLLDIDLTYREYRAAMNGLRELNVFFDEQLARVRRTPGSDVLSAMVQVEEDGDRLTDHELKASALLLLVAGFETTVNLIGNGFVALSSFPQERTKLLDDPSIWPNAIEEMLRWDPPVQYTARAATADVELDGEAVKRHRPVAALIGGANRDPTVFADPERFDVTRSNAREHLAFAAGIHYCLGASLARLEGEIALSTLLDRYPDVSLAGAPQRRRTRLLRGYDSLPVDLAGRHAAAGTRPSAAST
jgi:cytochrome P450